VPAGFRALVRRRRDGRVVFDLDLVHAGVVAEALEQTRAVLVDDLGPERAGGPVDGAGADEFDAIVARLGDVADEDSARRSIAQESLRGDPVLRRLLPDAYMDDAPGSAEFRRLSGDSVRGHKVAAIDSVLADLDLLRRQDGGLAVPPERAQSWLTALNDARLALGTLLAVGEDDDLAAELDVYEQQLVADQEVDAGATEPDEQALRAYRIAVYDFLSALLDMVVRALDR